MKKQDAKLELEKLKARKIELEKILNAPEITPEQRLLEILNGCEIKIGLEKYPNSIFFFKNGEYYFEIENDTIWCRYKNVWQVFETEFSLSYNEIRKLVEAVVEEHFKMKGLTAKCGENAITISVEEHFKMKGLTAKNK